MAAVRQSLSLPYLTVPQDSGSSAQNPDLQVRILQDVGEITKNVWITSYTDNVCSSNKLSSPAHWRQVNINNKISKDCKYKQYDN